MEENASVTVRLKPPQRAGHVEEHPSALARQHSPATAALQRFRYKIRPAPEKLPDCGRNARAGRVLYRSLHSQCQARQALSRVRQTSKQEATGADCGARGRRRGLAGQVSATQAPTVWRRRRVRRARLRCPWAAAGPGRATSRRAERRSRRGRRAGGPPPTAQPGPGMRKPRPADAGRGQPTQSGGKV